MIEALNSFDRNLFLLLNSFHIPAANPVMQFLSGQFIWIPFIGYFLFYSFRHYGKKFTLHFAFFLLLALVASDATSSYIIKNIVNRLRPCREIDLKPLIYSFGQKCGGKFGFVSSHAANAMALIIFSIKGLKFKKVTASLMIFIPIFVGYSRIYLGVHYPGDIFCGILVGITWGYVFSKMFKSIKELND